jgi:HSP20 family protein
MDVVEKDDKILVQLELPGLQKDDIKITLNRNVLTVEGEKGDELREENENYRIWERKFGKFRRSLTVPDDVMTDQITAKEEQGVLKIEMPRKEIPPEARRRQIQVA